MSESNRWEAWASGHFSGFWQEMCGVRETLSPDGTRNTAAPVQPDIRLEYAEMHIPFSDLNASRVIRRMLGNHLTHVGGDTGGRWYGWNGICHEEDEGGLIVNAVVTAFVDQMVMAIDHVGDHFEALAAAADASGIAPGSKNPPGRDTIMKLWREGQFRKHRSFQEKLHSDAGLNSLASRLRKIMAQPDDYFLNDAQWLVCQNGVIDLEDFRETRKINLLPHDPHRPVTRSVSCRFDREATSVEWDRFLATSQPDDEKREFLQRMVGAAFMGEAKVKAIINMKGPRDCGKSVFIDTIDQIADGYGVQPSPDALMQIQGQNWEQDTIRGRRFVGITEPAANKRLDDTFCKQVTGGDMVRTRSLHRASVEWRAQCVMFIASNDFVRFNTKDQAFLDRLCFVTFPHQFFDKDQAPEGEIHLKDEHLEEKLLAEKDGIFQWVIYGMWKYLRDGIAKPEDVKRAGEVVRTDSSNVLAWVQDKVEEGLLRVVDELGDEPMSSYILTSNLHSKYLIDEAMDYGKPLPRRQFTRELEARYGKQVNSGGRRTPKLVGINSWAPLNAAV